MVAIIFQANRIMAVSSMVAETGRAHQAAATALPYATTSEVTRRKQPAVSSKEPKNISLVLNKPGFPMNAGSIRGPTLKTISAKNPTVNAWREAPPMPVERSRKVLAVIKQTETTSQA
jgi:hypothetical protein